MSHKLIRKHLRASKDHVSAAAVLKLYRNIVLILELTFAHPKSEYQYLLIQYFAEFLLFTIKRPLLSRKIPKARVIHLIHSLR